MERGTTSSSNPYRPFVPAVSGTTTSTCLRMVRLWAAASRQTRRRWDRRALARDLARRDRARSLVLGIPRPWTERPLQPRRPSELALCRQIPECRPVAPTEAKLISEGELPPFAIEGGLPPFAPCAHRKPRFRHARPGL